MAIEVNASNMEEIMGTNYYRSTYEHSRKERLADVIGDYITDEDTSPEEFIDELKSEVNTWLEHHQKHAERCQKIMSMIDLV